MTVTGASTLTGNVTTAGQLLGANGTNALPTYSFTGATSTGFYNAAGIGPSISSGGNRALSVVSSGSAVSIVGDLSFETATSRILPGATSISLRNNANSADNLLITDAGNATLRGSLTVPSIIVGATAITTLTNKTGSGGGNYTTTSAAYVDVDGTNLAYAITVPTGFKMHITATASVKGTGLASTISFAVTDSTTILAEQSVEVAVAGDNETIALTHVFTGAGAASTFKLRWAVSTGTATMQNASATQTPRFTFFMAPSA